MTDKQLVRYAAQFRKGILGKRTSYMQCFAVCAPLAPLLEMRGIKVRLVEGDLGHCNHFWIELEDGRVLDPTADQFNALLREPLPPVYLGPPTAIHPAGAAT